MKITFSLSDEVVQNYLDYYNEVKNTNHNMKTLTPEQRTKVEKAFASNAVSEFKMRTDDHDGFETNRMFGKL